MDKLWQSYTKDIIPIKQKEYIDTNRGVSSKLPPINKVKSMPEIDLHGLSLEIAYKKLLEKIQECFYEKVKQLRVITGRSDNIESIQYEIDKWLINHQFKKYVKSFEKEKHTLEGSVIIRINKDLPTST